MPKDVSEHIRLAADALEVFMATGLSPSEVALRCEYEPGLAESFLRTVIREYGAAAVRPHCPAHIFSLVSPTERER
jgi:hypothetical protein